MRSRHLSFNTNYIYIHVMGIIVSTWWSRKLCKSHGERIIRKATIALFFTQKLTKLAVIANVFSGTVTGIGTVVIGYTRAIIVAGIAHAGVGWKRHGNQKQTGNKFIDSLRSRPCVYQNATWSMIKDQHGKALHWPLKLQTPWDVWGTRTFVHDTWLTEGAKLLT